jgi:hypothetical protein
LLHDLARSARNSSWVYKLCRPKGAAVSSAAVPAVAATQVVPVTVQVYNSALFLSMISIGSLAGIILKNTKENLTFQIVEFAQRWVLQKIFLKV